MKGFWRKRSQAAKLDLYMRVTLYLLPWLISTGALTPLTQEVSREPGAVALARGLLVLSVAQCAVSMHTTHHGLAHYVDRAPAPWRSAAVAIGLGGISVGSIVALQATGGIGDGRAMVAILPYALLTTAMSTFMLSTLRRLMLGTVVAAALVAGALAATGAEAGLAVAGAVVVLFVGLFALLTTRSSAWFMAVIWELDRNRDATARLAVAEERLRFGRDMHDVMGRNLAVIALKSELAVQLARRGRPEAADQMAEVQRIARESQREVREVVRGYREADLATELEGARGVLSAAGIECLMEQGRLGDDLPPGVQSALGWVVREATTNVLRHGDPRSCTVRLTAEGGRAVLVVENDGAGDVSADGTPGSGLAGLRERLSAVGGTLRAGPGGDGTFRLTAEVPMGQVVPVEPVVQEVLR
ncbi:sensor histidine kinase [Streptomyces sp. ISL-96]|uniref:sensor histidine kinase n=1 Tax=Streptomyces sp. ISL-96 TaxID=2819191 RepID=UPI001BE67BC9|nr:sensor histidine kinase [Streptomyces sp. ISL-96]MBT2492165.1 sensor histidine kinase [Streptomyces sp. ISL-96]